MAKQYRRLKALVHRPSVLLAYRSWHLHGSAPCGSPHAPHSSRQADGCLARDQCAARLLQAGPPVRNMGEGDEGEGHCTVPCALVRSVERWSSACLVSMLSCARTFHHLFILRLVGCGNHSHSHSAFLVSASSQLCRSCPSSRAFTCPASQAFTWQRQSRDAVHRHIASTEHTSPEPLPALQSSGRQTVYQLPCTSATLLRSPSCTWRGGTTRRNGRNSREAC